MSEIDTLPTDEEISEYTSKLKNDFPELEIETVKVIGKGWHHIALEVNGTLVFRVPRGVYSLDKLASSVSYETEILQRLQGKIPVAIPNPLYIAPQNAYFGYPKIQGVLLRDLVPRFSDEDRASLRQDWVNIAAEIHQAITVDEARALHIPDFEGAEPSSAERIFDISGIDESVLAFAEKTLKDVQSLDMSSQHYVFIHNDLQFHNMLADPSRNRISGLIDWTDVCVGPIAREFSTGEWMHGNLLEEVAALYEAKTGVKIDVDQARMWRHLEELCDYVEQVESGELEGAAETLESIRELISRHV